jgi:hypothetical protein
MEPEGGSADSTAQHPLASNAEIAMRRRAALRATE